MKQFVVVSLAVVCFGSVGLTQNQVADPLAAGAGRKALALQQQLVELNRDFAEGRRLINPRAILDLIEGFVIPTGRGPIGIDVEGSRNSNRYNCEAEYNKERKSAHFDFKKYDPTKSGWFSYQHLGQMANGCHVVETSHSGGGSGIFSALLILECAIEYEYGEDGKREGRLVIKRRGEYELGDRYQGEVTLDPKKNAIIISADGRNSDKPVRIQLDSK
ncbi:MAG: hypothetical protein JWN70_4333 [Planctomycetaceae bacterium]|nr:hypothetical protein [Planctomycetaceae bacterium]